MGPCLVDTAADSGPFDPSLIPLGEKKKNKQKRGQGWPIFKKLSTLKPNYIPSLIALALP